MIAAWLDELRTPPPRLARWQVRLFIVLWLAVAVSRLLACSQTLHDWDEALFGWGLREYDVSVDHPHPPGYPLFIAAGKLARLVSSSDFHALRGVSTVAGMFLFAAVFLVARELRLRFDIAVGAATLTSFLPTVWLYGGTALSDVPALTTVLIATFLLLRGARAERSYVAGCVMAAVAAGIRPQTLLIMAVPAIAGAIGLRSMRATLRAWLVGALALAITYLAAAYLSSDPPFGFMRAMQHNAHYVRTLDSFLNPNRASLAELAPRFLYFPYGGGRMRWVISALALAALVDATIRRRPAAWVVVLLFAPIAFFSWLMLDSSAAPRYAVAYAPLYSLLAAMGIGVVVEPLGRVAPGLRMVVATGSLAVVAGMMVAWGWSPIQLARHVPSPAASVFEWVRRQYRPEGSRIYVDNELEMHAAYFLPDYDVVIVYEKEDMPLKALVAGNLFVTEGLLLQPGGKRFVRQRKRLFEIARPRFFEVTAVPMQELFRYGEGWWGTEWSDTETWMWMSRASQTIVPTREGNGQLTLRAYLPLDSLPRAPTLTVTWNGEVLERVLCRTAEITLRYTLPSRSDWNELRMTVDIAANPKRDGRGSDDRDLGLMLKGIAWNSAAGE